MSPAVKGIILRGGFSPYRLPGIAARFDASDLGSITFDAANRVSQWNDKSGLGRHLVQATGASQPLLLPWNGANYVYLPGGGSANYISTPDSVPNSVTGDIEIQASVASVDWTPAVSGDIISKWGNGVTNQSWMVRLTTTGTLTLFFSTTGSNTLSATSSAAVPFADGSRGWIKVTRASASGNVNFATSTDGIAWTALGVQQTSTAGNIFDGASAVQVSGYTGAGSWIGNAYYAAILDGIGGTVVAKMDAAQAAHNATSWTSSTGEVWTVNQSGAVPAQIVGNSLVLFNGTNYFMQTATFPLAQPTVVYWVGRQITWTSDDNIYDGFGSSNRMTLAQLPSTPSLALYAGSGSGTNGNTGLPLATTGIVTALLSGAASLLRVNRNAPTTGDPGAHAPNGLTLGSLYTGGSNGNQVTHEVLMFAGAHDRATQDRAIQFLGRKWGIAV